MVIGRDEDNPHATSKTGDTAPVTYIQEPMGYNPQGVRRSREASPSSVGRHVRSRSATSVQTSRVPAEEATAAAAAAVSTQTQKQSQPVKTGTRKSGQPVKIIQKVKQPTKETDLLVERRVRQLIVKPEEGRVFYEMSDPNYIRRLLCLGNSVWELHVYDRATNLQTRPTWEFDFSKMDETRFATVAVFTSILPETLMENPKDVTSASSFAVFGGGVSGQPLSGFINDSKSTIWIRFSQLDDVSVVASESQKVLSGDVSLVVETYNELLTQKLDAHLRHGGARVRGLGRDLLTHLVALAKLNGRVREGGILRQMHAAKIAAEQSKANLKATWQRHEEENAREKAFHDANIKRIRESVDFNIEEATRLKQEEKARLAREAAAKAEREARVREETERQASRQQQQKGVQGQKLPSRPSSSIQRPTPPDYVRKSLDIMKDLTAYPSVFKLDVSLLKHPEMALPITRNFLSIDPAVKRRDVVNTLDDEDIRTAMRFIENAGSFSFPAFAFFMTGLRLDPVKHSKLSLKEIEALSAGILSIYHGDKNKEHGDREIYREVLKLATDYRDSLVPERLRETKEDRFRAQAKLEEAEASGEQQPEPDYEAANARRERYREELSKIRVPMQGLRPPQQRVRQPTAVTKKAAMAGLSHRVLSRNSCVRRVSRR